MSKITFPSVATLNAVNTINNNFALIANALQTNVLYRLNIDGEPNSLGSDIDANGKRIYNLPSPTSLGEPVTLDYANNNLGGNISSAAIAAAATAVASAATAVSSASSAAASAASASANAGSNSSVQTTASEIDVASATTTTVGGLTSNKIRITGTTTITSFGTNYNAPIFIRFAGALTLTHNATSLILPGATNILTAPGDTCVLTHKSTSGTRDGWQVISYQRARANIVNVKDYGDTDSASDDTSIFQAAYNAVPSLGVIVVPPGVYNVGTVTGTKRVFWDAVGATKPDGVTPLTLPGTVMGYRGPGYLQLTKTTGYAQDFAEFYVERDANYTGGTSGYVNTAGRFKTAARAGALSYEWSLVGIMDNYSTSSDNSENVGIYAQAIKNSTGKTFSHVAELIDKGGANPSTSSVAQELDLVAIGGDASRQRIITYMKAASYDGNPARVDTGLLLTTDNIASYNSGIGLSGFYNEYYINSGSSGNLYIKPNGATSLGARGSTPFLDAFFTIANSSASGVDLQQAWTDGSLKFRIINSGNVANTNNVYGAISDIAYKENIVDATPKLEDVLRTRVVNYNLKQDSNKTKQLGVIAQELEQVFPGLVENDADGLKMVKYSVFIPILIKAIQEQQVLIDQLTIKVNSL